jgi:hypothetical protein
MGAEDFFALKNPTASAEFEPTNLGTKGHHATPRPPKPLITGLCFGVKIWPWQRGWFSFVTEEKPADKNHAHSAKYLFPLAAIC